MLRFLRWVPFVVLAPLLTYAAFREEPPPSVVIPSAFRWRNSSWLEGQEEQAIQRNGLQRVYVKLLDIDWNSAHGAHPVSSVKMPYQWRTYGGDEGNWSDKVELVPSIYITNNTFFRISDKEVDELAHKLLRKLRTECPKTIHGVMLDCDWSTKTKAKFFRLARIMNDSLEVPVTATIRLHQYAQPGKTGIPPVDRGMLMPYNVGRITEPGSVNSIFDHEMALPYFSANDPYPLPLDIGLPAFSWGVQFRKGAFMGILQETQVNDAMNAGLLGREAQGTMQVVNEDNEHYPALHLGDEIRVERMTPEVIAQVAKLARSAVNSDTLAVVYFESGAANFQGMTTQEVRSGFERFGTIRADGFFDEERRRAAEAYVLDSINWSQADTAAVAPPDTTMLVEPQILHQR